MRSPFCTFEDRGLVLNKTNGNVLGDAWGDESESWRGRTIRLAPTRVPFQGKMRTRSGSKSPTPRRPRWSNTPRPTRHPIWVTSSRSKQMPALSLQQLARVLGGEVSGGQVRCPGPGHSPADRSMSVKTADNEDGFVVHSHAGDRWELCKDHVRMRLNDETWDDRSVPCPQRNIKP